jgi:hypothetical protein
MPKFWGNSFLGEINLCMVKKRIFENIYKIWHLPKGDLPKLIIYWHQGAEPNLGMKGICSVT